MEQQTEWDLIKGIPVHIFNYIVAHLLAVVSDTTFTSMALVGLVLGIGVAWWVGVAAYLSFAVLVQLVNSHGEAIVTGGSFIRNAIRATYRPEPPQDPPPSP